MVLLQIIKKGVQRVRIIWNCVRIGKIAVLLLIYSFGGAAIFCMLEANFSDRAVLVTNPGCLANYGYWASLHYVNTLYTTIGYGNVFCCSWPGRIVSCIYIFFGVPLFLVGLDLLGKIFAAMAANLWKMMCICGPKSKAAIKNLAGRDNRIAAGDGQDAIEHNYGDESIEQNAEKGHFPLSLGMLISLVWIMLTGAYFSYIEEWDMGFSLYFLWISMTTVGLGDATPSRFEYTIINFTIIIMGLSFVSMCVSILQTKIENMIRRLQQKIERQYKERLLNGGEAPEDDKSEEDQGFFGNIGKRFLSNSEDKLMGMLISKTAQEQIKTKNATLSKMVNKAVQTESIVVYINPSKSSSLPAPEIETFICSPKRHKVHEEKRRWRI